jgi:GNAT superfamily N-acetyltransferase
VELSNRFCHLGGWSASPVRQESSRENARTMGRKGGDDAAWAVRQALATDLDVWEELFGGYCDFYEQASSAEHRQEVWSWIEAGMIHCLLAVPADDPEGDAIGLAHVRSMPSPLRGTTVGFLDDLFISPAARGSGAFECLMEAIGELARAEGWPSVRWITSASNARARSAYERVATKTEWITYQLDP